MPENITNWKTHAIHEICDTHRIGTQFIKHLQQSHQQLMQTTSPSDNYMDRTLQYSQAGQAINAKNQAYLNQWRQLLTVSQNEVFNEVVLTTQQGYLMANRIGDILMAMDQQPKLAQFITNLPTKLNWKQLKTLPNYDLVVYCEVAIDAEKQLADLVDTY